MSQAHSSDMAEGKTPGRDRRLSIPLDFDKALRAALKVKPPAKPKREPRSKHKEQKPKPRD